MEEERLETSPTSNRKDSLEGQLRPVFEAYRPEPLFGDGCKERPEGSGKCREDNIGCDGC